MDDLRGKQLGLFDDLPLAMDETKLTQTQMKQQQRIDYINATFKNAQDYVREVYELGKEPFIQVVAVFCGKISEGNTLSSRTGESDEAVPFGVTGNLF